MTIHPSLLESIATLYGISHSQLYPVVGGHFSYVYEYTENQRAYILRITPPGSEIDLLAMQGILDWMAFLTAQGGPVPRLIMSNNHNTLEVMDFQGGKYIVSAFEKAPGALAETVALADWSDDLLQSLGRSLGFCNRLAQINTPPRPELKRPEWDETVNCFNPIDVLDKLDLFLIEKRDQVLAVIQALPRNPDCYGLAHLDLHLGNLFVDADRQRVSFFDFDDCGYGWFIMDIAMLLFDALVVYDGPDRERFGGRFLENVLQGYATQMPVTQFWVEQ
ncbi:MAG: phosphotransferase, partial [Anaerolineales bacterium]|nr:phosphotransferase [Anaerolineales bacterium]